MKNTILATAFVCSLLIAQPGYAHAASRSLSFGLRGADVTALQNQLIGQGFLAEGNNSGYFGQATLTAVKKFQCAKNLVCGGTGATGYGIAGPKTLTALANAGILTGTSLVGRATGAFEISGWVPDWRAASGTADVLPHLNQFTSVMPFGFTVSDDGKVLDSIHITQSPWPEFIAAAKKKKVRVVPTIMWGNGKAIHATLSNTAKRIALENEIADLVKRNNFDGIDIDFEAKLPETREYFSIFLKGLYQRIGKTKWVYCAIESRMPLIDRYNPGDTIPPDATNYANDYAQINKYCDRVEIMAYDQGTVNARLNIARAAPYAPVADPGWVESIVRFAAQDISKNKIIIGVPTYGYEYLVTPTGGSYKYKRLWAFNPSYAQKIAARLGITPTRTSANEVGFTYDPNALETAAPTDGNVATLNQTSATTIVQNNGSDLKTTQPFNYMTWSDAKSIADKVALAHSLGVRGVAVFSLGGAEDQAIWEILK